MQGQFKKHEGKIETINLKKTKVFVSGVELTKRDGTKRLFALHPSNLMITELNLLIGMGKEPKLPYQFGQSSWKKLTRN